MSNSDGEDSQMHSLPSSSPSTPPAPSSPPDSQPPSHATASGGITNYNQLSIDTPPASMHNTPLQAKGGDGGILDVVGEDGAGEGGAGSAGGWQPSWMGKRAVEEASAAREKLVDRGWTLKWAGDPFDESTLLGAEKS